MSFRDNLLYLRASHNMTQEQLAMMLGVSRQSVTKWEAEKSYPEMDKLLKMCQVFDCTLDELVQGDLTEREESRQTPSPSTPPADVFDYDSHMRRFAMRISVGVGTIIMGVALALPFFGASEPATNPYFLLPENIAAALGLLCVFLGVGIALMLIIPAGLEYSQFVRAHPYIEDFYTGEQKARARTLFAYQLVGGITAIFLGIIAVILFTADTENVFGATILLALTAIGVFLIVHGSMMLSRTDIARYNLAAGEVLEAQEISVANIPEAQKHELLSVKRTDKRIGAICGVIMIVATIIGLLLLFVPMASGGSLDGDSQPNPLFWLPWPIGGMLCGIVSVLMKGFAKD